MKRLDGPFLLPKSGTTARQLVIFLHGYGANGADLIDIGNEWADGLPDAAFVSPNAPEVCDMSPSGFQWFPIRAVDRALIERERPAAAVAPVLNAFIDAEIERWKVTEDKVAVVGFSQGAMMAMYTMPRRTKPCAGVIGYSGLIVNGDELKAENIAKMPILAIHGDADEIVPPENLTGVEQAFASAGFNVETVLRPGLGHGIDQFGLQRGLRFLQECFGIKG